MKTKYLFFFAVLVAVLSIGGCDLFGDDDEDDDSGDDSPSIAKMGITDAASLFIAPSSGNSKAGYVGRDGDEEEPNRMFKITDGGFVQEVSYEDDDGNIVTTSESPSAVVNVDDSYVIVVFEKYSDDIGYLVRKTDGAVFSLENVGTPIFSGLDRYMGDEVTTDSSGNIYYKAEIVTGAGDSDDDYHTAIVKIDVSDPSALTKTDREANGDDVDFFVMDPAGNIVYGGMDSSVSRIFRFTPTSGGNFKNLGGTHGQNAWLGLNNLLYFHTGEYSDKVQEITSPSPYAASDYHNTGIGTEETSISPIIRIFRMEDPSINKLISVGEYHIDELYNDDRLPKNITNQYSGNLLGLDKIKTAGASDDYYYVSGNDSSSGNPQLLKVDPNTHTPTSITAIAGKYDIYKLVVSPDNEITFNAARLSDGAKVIAKINAAGELTVIDETLNTQLVALERIN